MHRPCLIFERVAIAKALYTDLVSFLQLGYLKYHKTSIEKNGTKNVKLILNINISTHMAEKHLLNIFRWLLKEGSLQVFKRHSLEEEAFFSERLFVGC